jgi:hypothetical protein
LQDLSLHGGGFTCTLQCSAVNEVQYNAVGKLLLVLIRRVWRLEFSEVEALSDALWVRYRRTQDKVAQSIGLNESAFPKLYDH